MNGLLTYYPTLDIFTLDFPYNNRDELALDSREVAVRLNLKVDDEVTTEEGLRVTTPVSFKDKDTELCVITGNNRSVSSVEQFDEIFPDLVAVRAKLESSMPPQKSVTITEDDLERLRVAIAAVRPDTE